MVKVEGSQSKALLRSVVPYLISFGALAFLVAPTLESVFSRWLKFDESYSHGLLLLVVSIAITAQKWRADPPVAGCYPLWIVPFLLALAGYAMGGILRVEALQQLALIPLILSALALLIGWEQGRKFILPVGLMIFTMPFWDYISWPLQLMTVAVNEFGLGFLDIDFTIDGVYVYLTGVGAFEVANGCSGLRYLLVGQSLALLYGELNLRLIRSRVILFCAAVGLSLVANWVRVLVIIYMGHETNMQSSLIENHDNFGWWVFAATLVPLFLFGRRLEKTAAEQAPAEESADSGALDRSRSSLNHAAYFVVAGLSVIALLALPVHEGSIKKVPDTYDVRLDGGRFGQIFSPGLAGWRPRVSNPDRVFQQTLFRRSDVEGESDAAMPPVFYVSIHTYEFQRQGAEVVQYHNRTYDHDQWRLDDIYSLSGPDGRDFRGMTLQSRVSGETIHLAYGYYVEGFWQNDQIRAKLSQLAGFFNARTDASQITFGVACGGCDGPEALNIFINQNLPTLIEAVNRLSFK